MGIFELIVFGISCIAFATIGGLLFANNAPEKNLLGVPCLVFSFFCLLTFAVTSKDILKDGSPLNDISVGTYKIASIYEAGGNVTMELEIPNEHIPSGNEIEHIYSYQFPINAFDGNAINKNAKKLVVVKDGSFKKLYLE